MIKSGLALLLISLTTQTVRAEEVVKFKNPLFYQTLYYNENLRDPKDITQYPYIDLKPTATGMKMRHASCTLVENTPSHMTFKCQLPPNKYISFYEPYWLSFYSIGKNDKGFCQVASLAKSDLDKAQVSYVYDTESTDCGATEPAPKVQHTWLHAPEKPFTEFKNPIFGIALEPWSRHAPEDYNRLLTPNTVGEEKYSESHEECVLIKNTDQYIAFECDAQDPGLELAPKKVFHSFELDLGIIGAINEYYPPEMAKRGVPCDIKERAPYDSLEELEKYNRNSFDEALAGNAMSCDPYVPLKETRKNTVVSAQKDIKFKNPLFNQPLIFYDAVITNPISLKANGLYSVVTHIPCLLLEETPSRVSYKCRPTSYEDGSPEEDYYPLTFYSIGKNKKGYCQIASLATSPKDNAVVSHVYAVESTDCGATEPAPKVQHKWLHAPEKPFTEFKNPIFAQPLKAGHLYNYGYQLLLSPTSKGFNKKEFNGIKEYPNEFDTCTLVENNELNIILECDKQRPHLLQGPRKEFYYYEVTPEVEEWTVGDETFKSCYFTEYGPASSLNELPKMRDQLWSIYAPTCTPQ